MSAGFVLLVSGTGHASPTNGLRFHVPDGWVDLSREAPEANLSRVLPTVRERAEARRADPASVFFAAPTNAPAVMNATLRSEADSEPVDEEALGRARSQLGWHGLFRTDEAHIEVVNGLAWGRFTGKSAADDGIRFVTYLVPGRPQSVFLLFAAPADCFDELLPAFEKAARATDGAQNPEPKSHAPTGTEFAFLGLFAAGLLAWIRLRRVKEKAVS